MKRAKLIFTLFSALFLLLTLPNPALAETKTLSATEDTYANQAYPVKVNGLLPPVIVSNKYTTRLGYIKFDNPDLPEGSIIDSATLRLFFDEVHYADQAKVNVGPVTEEWSETAVTWDTKPVINQSQATEATLIITDTGWKNIGVKDMVEKWQDGSLPNEGLFIYPFGFLYSVAESEFAFTFNSIQATENPPQIVIEYHLEAEATATPTQVTPTLEPAIEPTPVSETEATDSPTLEITPTPFESVEKATPTEGQEGFNFSLTTGQMIIAGLIGLSLLGAVVAFVIYFVKQPDSKKTKRKKTKKTSETREPETEKKTSSAFEDE